MKKMSSVRFLTVAKSVQKKFLRAMQDVLDGVKRTVRHEMKQKARHVDGLVMIAEIRPLLRVLEDFAELLPR